MLFYKMQALGIWKVRPILKYKKYSKFIKIGNIFSPLPQIRPTSNKHPTKRCKQRLNLLALIQGIRYALTFMLIYISNVWEIRRLRKLQKRRIWRQISIISQRILQVYPYWRHVSRRFFVETKNQIKARISIQNLLL